MENKRQTAAQLTQPATALREVIVRLNAWKDQRTEIAAQLRQIVATAGRMLTELGNLGTSSSPAPSNRKGGRPRGYKTSPETRARLRAAWARRRAAGGGTAEAGARSGSSASKPQRKKRVMSAEARARIAAAQKRRWASVKKAAKK